MNGSIYLIKNEVNNKMYIGQTIQPVEKRFKQHLKLLETNEKQAISKAIKSIGKDKFSYEVLDTGIENYETLNKLEEFYIKQYNTLSPFGYNLCPGGQKWRRVSVFTKDDENKIISMYEKGMSTRGIGELYSVSPSTISGVLRRNNIKIRAKNHKLPDRTSKLTLEIMEELYVQKGMKMKDIAEELNVNVRTVNRAKRLYNLQRI